MTETAGFGLTDSELATHDTVFACDALKGRLAVISGGGGGIGRAIAWLYARLGAEIVVTGRDAEKTERLAEALRAAGHVASGETLDIRDRPQVDGFWARQWDESGGADILVNSAGGQFPQAAIDFSPKGWNAVIDTNLNGTWNMMQAAALKWRDFERPGCIVNIVVVTTHGLYGVAHSTAARAGVVALSRSVAVEWAPHNIRTNCIAPGAIETEGWNVYSTEARAAYPKTNPMMRAGTAWDIAQASAFLSAASGNFITGEVLTVDGGGQHWGETWTTGKPQYFKT